MPHEYNPADYQLTEKGARLIEVEQGSDLHQAEYDILEAVMDGSCGDLADSYSNYTLAHETHELEKKGLISRKASIEYQAPEKTESPENQDSRGVFLGPRVEEFPL